MKIRSGFVSNSSSSSFVIYKRYLSQDQIERIRDNQNCGAEDADKWPWDISETDEKIEGFTIINNFDMIDWMINVLNVEEKYIEYSED